MRDFYSPSHCSDPLLQPKGHTMSTSLVNRVLATDNAAAALALRIPVGIIFAAHGAQKLFGSAGRLSVDRAITGVR